MKQSEKCLYEFLREYDIFPNLITKSSILQIYLYSKNKNNEAIYDETVN